MKGIKLGKPRTLKRYKSQGLATAGKRRYRTVGTASVNSLAIKRGKKSFAVTVRPVINL